MAAEFAQLGVCYFRTIQTLITFHDVIHTLGIYDTTRRKNAYMLQNIEHNVTLSMLVTRTLHAPLS